MHVKGIYYTHKQTEINCSAFFWPFFPHLERGQYAGLVSQNRYALPGRLFVMFSACHWFDSNTDCKFIVSSSENFMLILDVRTWKREAKMEWQKWKLHALYSSQTILFGLYTQDLTPCLPRQGKEEVILWILNNLFSSAFCLGKF